MCAKRTMVAQRVYGARQEDASSTAYVWNTRRLHALNGIPGGNLENTLLTRPFISNRLGWAKEIDTYGRKTFAHDPKKKVVCDAALLG